MMDETDTPATPATSVANEHEPASTEVMSAATAPSPPETGDPDKLPLTPEGWEYLADLKWVNQEYNHGRFEPYMGNYIAVYRKQLLGYGPDLLALRERMAREHNVSPDRILIEYVETPMES